MFLMGCSPTDSMINRIGFIGNYLPRQCDIATFTTDLWEAIAAEYGGTTCIALPTTTSSRLHLFDPHPGPTGVEVRL